MFPPFQPWPPLLLTATLATGEKLLTALDTSCHIKKFWSLGNTEQKLAYFSFWERNWKFHPFLLTACRQLQLTQANRDIHPWISFWMLTHTTDRHLPLCTFQAWVTAVSSLPPALHIILMIFLPSSFGLHSSLSTCLSNHLFKTAPLMSEPWFPVAFFGISCHLPVQTVLTKIF